MTNIDIFKLEECLWIAHAATNVPAYDFDFSTFFSIRRPWQRPEAIKVVGRFGASSDYDGTFSELLNEGLSLIHDPAMHVLCSELPTWYPLIEEFTPYSRWYAQPPSVAEIEAHFSWPVFIKGSRQTSRHKEDLAIVRSPDQYQSIRSKIADDPILSWQALVVREFLELRPVNGGIAGKIPASFEFRTFWWRGECVGSGPYHTAANYSWTPSEKNVALAIAKAVAQRVQATFLVIDLAQTTDGQWRVIELNDGQESGYVGVSRTALWQNIIDIERNRLSDETG